MSADLNQISSDWTAFKSAVLASGLKNYVQYTQSATQYCISVLDGRRMYSCVIWLGPLPDGVLAGGYTQEQNDADKADFEANFLPLSNTSLPVQNVDLIHPTFSAIFDRVQPGANKYVAVLFNTSALRKLVIQRIMVYNWQVTPVSGVLLEQQLERITAITGGTAASIRSHDTMDSLPTGVSAVVAPSSVTSAHLLGRVFATNDEMSLSSNSIATWRADLVGAVIYERRHGTKGYTLRQNEGIAVKNVTSSTVGTLSYIFEFTSEAP